jgi:hypothetical protein
MFNLGILGRIFLSAAYAFVKKCNSALETNYSSFKISLKFPKVLFMTSQLFAFNLNYIHLNINSIKEFQEI